MITAYLIKKLYDGKEFEPRRDVIVAFDENQILDIAAAEEREKIEYYSQFLRDSQEELYMMPGLIDCHVHLMLPGDGTWGEDEVRSWSKHEIAIQAYRNAELALKSGVTAMRDCGCYDNIAEHLKNVFIMQQDTVGPDIVSCAAPLTCTGGHCFYMGGETDGTEGIRRKIREQKKAGADFVKVMASYGATRGITKTFTFSDEELKTAIDEARLRNMKLAAHSTIFEMTKKLAELGVDTIEHTVMCDSRSTKNYLDDELVGLIKEKNIYVDHTLNCVSETVRRLGIRLDEGLASAEEEEQYRLNKRYQELIFESFEFQVKGGVPFVVGTDSGWRYTNFKTGYYENIYEMQNHGATPGQLIIAATARAAKAIGIDNISGTIEAGKQADVLILDKDPGLDLAEAIKKPRGVYKKGRLIK